jgi:hypothetical protein
MTDPVPPAGMPLPEAMAGNFQDAMRWFGQMWAGGTDLNTATRAGGPIPSMMMPTMDPQEIDKRIADLRSVEHWLSMNLAMLRTTIQGLEMQRTALAAWQNLGAAAAPGAVPDPATQAAFQPAAWWGALQQQFAQMAAQAGAQESAPPPASGGAPEAPAKAPRPRGPGATHKA